MGFAERYINQNIIYPGFVKKPVDYNLGMIVVVPVYNEFEITEMLDSIARCKQPVQLVEVFLVINESVDSGEEVILQNKKTVRQIEQWEQNNATAFFDLHVLVPPPFSKKHAGAGLARKTGMDEAIRRFAAIENKEGIIISLDADTLVDSSYFVEIEDHFRSNTGHVGACVKFRHRIEEIADGLHKKGMLLYEDYLYYYRNSLSFTGYPHAIHTIGSAFAVKADAYVKQGGMNRRQAGEDFYFLHKLSQFGKIGTINSTCVYPSARLSDRVPFGTGPALQKWVKGDKSLNETYSFRAFQDLKELFDLLPYLYKPSIKGYNDLPKPLSEPLSLFLQKDAFDEALIEIRNNSSSFDSFNKRFFQYFNAFKILKFMNFSHPAHYPFQNVHEAVMDLQSQKKD